MALSGMLAYVADGAVGGLQIVDVSNPAAPSVLGGVVTPGTAKGVDVSGTLALVADGALRFRQRSARGFYTREASGKGPRRRDSNASL